MARMEEQPGFDFDNNPSGLNPSTADQEHKDREKKEKTDDKKVFAPISPDERRDDQPRYGRH